MKKTRKYGAVAIKHRLVLRKMQEKQCSLKQAQIEAGYSPAYAHDNKITKTKTWPEIMEEAFPDELLTKVHREGLSATKEVKDIGIVDDYAVRHQYLDTAYKLKNRYGNVVTIKGSFSQLSASEIEDAIAGEVSEALLALTGEK